ncbi:MAG: ethanolamine ammonia-lyase subunit EutC [Lactobacillaceae bacterium]|jgi:ethanolamine ammonia-lyase small subunit|nr:ethanolamine ammonia-lyase subunit EutC [Lactobacillaceae bacterium]
MRNEQGSLNPRSIAPSVIEDAVLADIEAVNLQTTIGQTTIANRAALLNAKAQTPARLGMGRAGTRYKTASMLRFLADHALAKDAVNGQVSTDLVAQMGWVSVQTTVTDQIEYIKNPPKGRRFNAETLEKLGNALPHKPTIQIVVGDGLSSAAIEANVAKLLPLLKATLNKRDLDIDLTAIPFVKFARVNSLHEIGQVVDAQVVCILIGERPGLITDESMSAYVAYNPKVGMPDSNMTVISNIHAGGTTVEEAAEQLSELFANMLKYQTAGLELKAILQSTGERV